VRRVRGHRRTVLVTLPAFSRPHRALAGACRPP